MPSLKLEDLKRFQSQADSLADDTVSTIFGEKLQHRANELLADLLYATDSDALADAHPKLQEFLAATRQLPPWADQERIIRGQEFFNLYSPICLLSLIQASLPECYVNFRISSVLGETQKLEERAYKRIIETAQFLLYVMVPNGFTVAGVPDMGIRVIQRVRLIHAAIRYLVNEQHEGDALENEVYAKLQWGESEGAAISQLDLAYTLQTFSAVTLRSLRRFGIAYTDEQADDFNHCWNVIGHVLGIEEDLLFDSAAESEQFFMLVKDEYGTSTEEGKAMTDAAQRVLQQMLKDKLIFIGWLLSVTLPRPILFQMLDEPTRDQLGVRKANPIERFVWFPLHVGASVAATVLNRYLKIPLTGQLLKFLGYGIMKYFSEPPEYLGKANFEIPDSLVEAKKLKWYRRSLQTSK